MKVIFNIHLNKRLQSENFTFIVCEKRVYSYQSKKGQKGAIPRYTKANTGTKYVKATNFLLYFWRMLSFLYLIPGNLVGDGAHNNPDKH